MSAPLRSFVRLAVCVTTLLAALPATAAQLQDGQWSMTTRTSMDGKAVPPVTVSYCVTPEQARAPVETVAQIDELMKAQKCRLLDQKQGADSLSYRLVCAGTMTMTAVGQFTFSATTYTGTLDVTMGNGSRMRSDITARRTGACTSK